MNQVSREVEALNASVSYWLGFLVLWVLLLLACSSESAQTATLTPHQLELGQQLYSANCASCHGGATGGSMMSVPPPHNASGHTWHHPDCQIINTVLEGPGEMSDMMREMMGVPEESPRMPAFKGTLTEEEVRAVLGYIKTWWTDEQRRHQERVTRQIC